ncbi:RHS repeat-associated core domain-containing protein [Pseudomonas brassicacearum]|uniref:RHS repeat-associated core domain-containing protein n=1 Tax=Pseudomonas brassicacearum TaxID=930166 RepID=UPI00223B1709|nr:RHS repeat-associated core domain-containing protein [Pseudomonas brassicacearum]
MAVNQSTVFSLSGAALLSDNSDAGWRLGLLGATGQQLQGWDQKRNQSRAIHDDLLRPSAVFEQAHGEPERCTERFSYADATAETAAHNRCGRLIRLDDTAGTQHFTEFSLASAPLEQSRQFIADPQWLVNWPDVETERDALLELEPAITRVRHNAVGEPCEQTDAGGNRQIFSQTRAGKLQEVRLKLDGAAEEKTLVSAIRYNAFGQIEQQRAGNGVVSYATYAVEDGRLLQLKAQAQGKAPLQDLTYDYDPAGNIYSVSDAAQSTRYFRNQRVAAINTYEYDSLYRLIFASGRQTRNAPGGPHLPAFQSPADPGQLENYQQTYHYDRAGNLELLQHSANSGSRTEHTAVAALSNRSLPYNADGEHPDEDEIHAGYDLNGNLNTLQPGQSLMWDLRNQLRQVDQVEREEEPHDAEIYIYDSGGQRQRKIRTAYTGTLTHTHETRYLPGVETRTGPKETLHVITVQAGRCTVQVLHWKKGMRADIPENQHRYTFTDHLGSSTQELDDLAELISQENYYPYGGTCWWAGRDKVEASYKTIRYSGKERDATGLYYYGHRYYLPWRQRWLSADPAGTADGLNLYAMVAGNPISHVDMQGLMKVDASRFNAAAAAAVRDGAAAAFGIGVQLATRHILEQIPPSPEVNFGLHMLAASLEGGAALYVGYGLTKGYTQSSGIAAIVGVVGAISAATPALLSEQGVPSAGSDPELHSDAIGRIAAVLGGYARQFAADTFTPGAAIKFQATAGFSEKSPSVLKTSLGYGVIRAGIGALNSLLPSSISGILGPVAESIDGFLGTYMRPYPSDHTYYDDSTNAAIPSNWGNTLHGGAGRSVSGSTYRFLNGLLTPYIKSLHPALQGALSGLLGFYTEGRGLAMEQVKKGYIKDSLSPLLDIEAPGAAKRGSDATPSNPHRGYWEGSLHLDRLFREQH